MTSDLRDALDHSFGDGPAAAPPEEALRDGRRRLRRRRLAEAAAVLTVAVVAVTGAAVATGGSSDRASTPVAGNPTPTPTPTPDQPSSVQEATPRPYRVLTDGAGLGRGTVASLDADGVVHVRRGASVDVVLRNPYDVAPPARSVAAAVRQDGEVTWFAGYADAGGGASAFQPAVDGVRFADWVAEQSGILPAASGTAPDPTPDPGDGFGDPDVDLVRFGAGETLVPLDGVTVLEQRPSPQVGDSFALPSDRSAVAEVSVDGQRWYVLARGSDDGPAQYIAVRASDGGPTLDAFLELARERYAEGGGGLL